MNCAILTRFVAILIEHERVRKRPHITRAAAMQALLLVAEHDGPTMFARIGVMRALNRHAERVFDPSRRGQALGTPQAGAASMTEASEYSGFRLLWRAKLADKPRRSRWQLHRVNPIAFPASKRPRPFTVKRHHKHHQGAAVLASLR